MNKIISLQATIEDWYAINVPLVKLREIVEADPVFCAEMKSFGIDTCVREQAVSLVSSHVCGKPWPIGGDSAEKTQSFFDDFYSKAPSFGIVIKNKIEAGS